MLSLRMSTIFRSGKLPCAITLKEHLVTELFQPVDNFVPFGSLSLAETINCKSYYITYTGEKVTPINI